MKKALFIILFMLGDPKNFVVEDFELSYQYMEDRIYFKLSAPTSGWIMIGFNTSQSIKKSYLVFGAFKNSFSEVEDHWVRDFGDHVALFELAEGAHLLNCRSFQIGRKAFLEFSLPIKPTSKYSPAFEKGSRKFVWLAYSDSDDFDHHSTKRIGKWITFK